MLFSGSNTRLGRQSHDSLQSEFQILASSVFAVSKMCEKLRLGVPKIEGELRKMLKYDLFLVIYLFARLPQERLPEQAVVNPSRYASNYERSAT